MLERTCLPASWAGHRIAWAEMPEIWVS